MEKACGISSGYLHACTKIKNHMKTMGQHVKYPIYSQESKGKACETSTCFHIFCTWKCRYAPTFINNDTILFMLTTWSFDEPSTIFQVVTHQFPGNYRLVINCPETAVSKEFAKRFLAAICHLITSQKSSRLFFKSVCKILYVIWRCADLPYIELQLSLSIT